MAYGSLYAIILSIEALAEIDWRRLEAVDSAVYTQADIDFVGLHYGRSGVSKSDCYQ